MDLRFTADARGKGLVLVAITLSGIPLLLFMATTASATSPPPFLTTGLTPSNGSQSTLNGYTGASITYTNTLSTSEPVFVFASVVNQQGQTVGVSLQSSTIASGASSTFFFSEPQLAHGAYTVTIFATTRTLVPLSVSTAVHIQV